MRSFAPMINDMYSDTGGPSPPASGPPDVIWTISPPWDLDITSTSKDSLVLNDQSAAKRFASLHAAGPSTRTTDSVPEYAMAPSMTMTPLSRRLLFFRENVEENLLWNVVKCPPGDTIRRIPYVLPKP